MGKSQVADFVIFESGLLPDRVAICVGDMITTYLSPTEARKLADILYALAESIEPQKDGDRERGTEHTIGGR